MRRIGLVSALVITAAIGAGAQRLSEVVDLTDGKPCGDPQHTSSVMLTGVVKKRDFAEGETILSGFVLQDKKDQRFYINLDREYLKDHASGNTVDDLSDVLGLDKFVRVKATTCGKQYLAVRVKGVRE